MFIILIAWAFTHTQAQSQNESPVSVITVDSKWVTLHQLSPEFLKHLKNVRRLEIRSDVDFIPAPPESAGTLPDLSELANLSELSIGYMTVNDLSSISKLTQLEHLTLGDNPVRDLSPISKLSNLKELALDHFDITDLSFLSLMTGLERLSINCWNEEVVSLAPIVNLQSLKSLDIWELKVRGVPPLEKLEQLEKIRLYSNGISDISFLANMPNLKELSLNDNQISDLAPLATLPTLSSLSLSGNQIQDIAPLVELNNLNTLILYDNPLNENAYEINLPQIINNNPNVGIGCYIITGSLLQDLQLPAIILFYLSAVSYASVWLWRRKRKKLILLVIGGVVLSLLPLPIREKDIKKIILHSISSLLHDQRVVMLNKGYIPFPDSRYVNKYVNLVYRNELRVDDGIFNEMGLEPYDEDQHDFAFGRPFGKNVIIEFTYRDDMESVNTNSIHFNYYHGLLAAQGHRVVIYRNLFGVFPLYVFEWVS